MPRGDHFYVIEFRNPEIDDHIHFMTLQVDSQDRPLRHVRLLKGHNDKLEIDENQALKPFASKGEAEKEAHRRADVANQANPDRIGFDQRFSAGEANRALSAGMQGATPKPGEQASE